MNHTPLDNIEKIYILAETHDLLKRKLKEMEESDQSTTSVSLDLFKIEKEIKKYAGNQDLDSIKKQINPHLLFPYS